MQQKFGYELVCYLFGHLDFGEGEAAQTTVYLIGLLFVFLLFLFGSPDIPDIGQIDTLDALNFMEIVKSIFCKDIIDHHFRNFNFLRLFQIIDLGYKAGLQ